MRQVFPFGRGDRGSRQRLVVEFSKWGEWRLTVHQVKVSVLRTKHPDLVVLLLGTSKWNDRRRGLVFRTQFVEAFKTAVQAGRDFRHVRKVNKLWQQKRKEAKRG